MKNIFILIVITFISISSFAQQGINYKALIKDDLGNVVANQNVSIQFTILDALAAGTIEYQGTHNSLITDANGILIANIGEGQQSLSYGLFNDIDWGSHAHYLQVGIDITGGTNFEDMGTTEFKAIPYAKHAEIAANVSGLEQITELNPDTGFNQTGWRLVGRIPSYYGIIGTGAVDLSYSDSDASEEKGATGTYSTTIGYNSEASEYNSTAIGTYANASDTNAIAIGSGASASGDSAIALGSYTFASGSSSTAMGNNTSASGKYATAIGFKTTASSYAETAIGSYNTSYIPEDTVDWAENDRLFVIGNGNSPSTTNNALTVLKNGNISVGGESPESLLEVTHKNGAPTSNLRNAFSIRNSDTNNSWQFYTATYLNLYKDGVFKGSWNSNSGAYVQASDRRVKKDINPLENGTLNKVMQLNPVSYLMKDQKDNKRNLGLISQEVKEIFPSITHYVKESDVLALSYTELIPILIKALQEQQGTIETQNSKIETQHSENTQQNQAIQSLLQRMNALEAANN